MSVRLKDAGVTDVPVYWFARVCGCLKLHQLCGSLLLFLVRHYRYAIF